MNNTWHKFVFVEFPMGSGRKVLDPFCVGCGVKNPTPKETCV